MMASRTGNVAAMKVLLDHGADVNAKEDPARDDGVDVGRGPGPSGRRPALDRRAGRTSVPARIPHRRPSGRAADRTACARGRASPKIRGSSQKSRDATACGDAAQEQQDTEPSAATQTAGTTAVARIASGGGLTPLVFAARRNDLDIGADSAGGRRRCEPGHGVRLEPVAGGDPESVLPARRRSCSTRARTRTSPTRAAGRRCISRWITATSKAAIIRCARATWTIWISSRNCWTMART